MTAQTNARQQNDQHHDGLVPPQALALKNRWVILVLFFQTLRRIVVHSDVTRCIRPDQQHPPIWKYACLQTC